MKLSAQLIMIMIAAVVISLFAAGYFSFAATQKALEQSIGENQQELAKETMNKIDRLMFQKFQEIQVIADADPIENPLLYKANGAGSEEISREIGETRQRLEELLLQTGPWDVISLIDREGKIIISTLKGNSAENIKIFKESNAAFLAALNGRIYYSKLLISSQTGFPTVIFAAPVTDEQAGVRPIIGAVVAEFSWPVVLEILDEIKLGDVHLFNKNGIAIGSGTEHRHEILQEDLKNAVIVQQALQGKCGSLISESKNVNLAERKEKIPALSSCSLQNGHLGYKGNGWGIAIETPADVAFAPVKKLTNRFIVIGLIISLLLIPIILILSANITSPIKKLKSSADRISKGFFDEKIDVKGRDEITGLAESFDNMRYSLKMAMDEYEKIKGKEWLQKNLQLLEKKQAETIKNLKISIAEQKLARAGEQKALANYREMEAKLEYFSKFPEKNPNIVMDLDNLGAVKYSNPAASIFAKNLKLSVKGLLPKNYKVIVKKLSGTDKSSQLTAEIKGKKFIFAFAGSKDEKSVLVTGVEVKV
jgi:HAMP domain-containing protein